MGVSQNPGCLSGEKSDTTTGGALTDSQPEWKLLFVASFMMSPNGMDAMFVWTQMGCRWAVWAVYSPTLVAYRSLYFYVKFVS